MVNLVVYSVSAAAAAAASSSSVMTCSQAPPTPDIQQQQQQGPVFSTTSALAVYAATRETPRTQPSLAAGTVDNCTPACQQPPPCISSINSAFNGSLSTPGIVFHGHHCNTSPGGDNHLPHGRPRNQKPLVEGSSPAYDVTTRRTSDRSPLRHESRTMSQQSKTASQSQYVLSGFFLRNQFILF